MASARKRPSIRARVATKGHTSATVRNPTPSSPKAATRITKKEKRKTRHDSLINRVRSGAIQKPSQKVRRPQNKLQAVQDVNDLRNALPDIPPGANADADSDGEWSGLSDAEDQEDPLQGQGAGAKLRRQRADGVARKTSARMTMQSLKHRPGAMKRKARMEQGEMERFSKNLAQLSGSGAGGSPHSDGQAQPVSTSGEKWAALRRFIGGTMERDKAFSGD